MKKLLKDYEECLQAVYKNHIKLLPNSETVELDKGDKYLIPFSTKLEAESNRIGEILVPKLVESDRSSFIDKSLAIYKVIYQQYQTKLGDIKTSKLDNENAIFLP